MPGESINHYTGIRIRVTGTGTLRTSFNSLNEIDTYTLPPLTLVATNRVEPTRLGNMMTQRCMLRGETTDFGDNFVITRIVILIKPQVFSEYPA